MIRATNIKDLRREYAKVKGGVASDTIFMARAAMLSCEMLAAVTADIHKLAKKAAAPRALTAYQSFMREGLRAGKPMQQISKEWEQKKNGSR